MEIELVSPSDEENETQKTALLFTKTSKYAKNKKPLVKRSKSKTFKEQNINNKDTKVKEKKEEDEEEDEDEDEEENKKLKNSRKLSKHPENDRHDETTNIAFIDNSTNVAGIYSDHDKWKIADKIRRGVDLTKEEEDYEKQRIEKTEYKKESNNVNDVTTILDIDKSRRDNVDSTTSLFLKDKANSNNNDNGAQQCTSENTCTIGKKHNYRICQNCNKEILPSCQNYESTSSNSSSSSLSENEYFEENINSKKYTAKGSNCSIKKKTCCRYKRFKYTKTNSISNSSSTKSHKNINDKSENNCSIRKQKPSYYKNVNICPICNLPIKKYRSQSRSSSSDYESD